MKTRINPVMRVAPNRSPRRRVLKGLVHPELSPQTELRSWQRADLTRCYFSIRLAQTLDEDVEEDEP